MQFTTNEHFSKILCFFNAFSRIKLKPTRPDCYYRPQRSWGKLIFSEACVNNSVHRGGVCVVAQGGHAWFYSGGMCGFIRGACMVLFGGQHGFIWGGMRGFIWGACVVLFGGHAWFYLGGHAWFYSGGRAWFYSGGMRGFFSFSDTMRYGQWAGSAHPTGMHSCLKMCSTGEL